MERKALLEVLELVRPALADQNLVPVFQNFCFTGETVYAYNDSLGIVGKLAVETPFSVFGSTFYQMLKKSKAKELELDLEEGEVKIKAGRSIIKLPYMTEEDFIFTEPEDVEWPITVEGTAEILAGIMACLTTASDDTSAPTLMGLTLSADKDGRVTLYTCDGDAISRYRLAKKEGVGPANTALTVPTAFFKAVRNIVTELEVDTFTINVSDEWAKAEVGDYLVYGRVILKEAPVDHEDLIKKTLKGKVEYMTVPKPLDAALDRARVLADIENSATTIAVAEGKLRLRTETHNGNVKDVIALEGEYPDVEALVSAALVQRSIEVCDEIAILEGCTAYRKGDTLLQVISNMGD